MKHDASSNQPTAPIALSRADRNALRAAVGGAAQEWKVAKDWTDENWGWGAVLFQDCGIEELWTSGVEDADCECIGWEWSDLFHATEVNFGSREEVTRWVETFLATRKSGDTRDFAIGIFLKSAYERRVTEGDALGVALLMTAFV